MQSQIILLSNVKQDNVAQLVQKEFEMLGITGIKGKRIDAERAAIHKTVAESLADYNVIMIIGGMGEKFGNMTVSAVSAAIGFKTVLKDGELFPEGAEIFRNKQGRPSGCAVAAGNQCGCDHSCCQQKGEQILLVCFHDLLLYSIIKMYGSIYNTDRLR